MVRADKRKFHYIYKITRNNSDRYYIGMHSTDNMDDGYFGSGTRLWKSIEKYGKENHTMEILEFCESREQLKIREKEIIGDLYRLDENCMNLVPGGNGGFPESCYGFHSEEHRQKFADAAAKSVEKMKKRSEHDIEYACRRYESMSLAMKKAYENGRSTSFENSCIRTLGVDAAKTPEANAKRKNTFKERDHQQGEKNSQFGKRYTYVYSDELKQCKRIGKEDPIPEGWKKGRKLKF